MANFRKIFLTPMTLVMTKACSHAFCWLGGTGGPSVGGRKETQHREGCSRCWATTSRGRDPVNTKWEQQTHWHHKETGDFFPQVSPLCLDMFSVFVYVRDLQLLIDALIHKQGLRTHGPVWIDRI